MAPCFLSLLFFLLLSTTAGGQRHNHWGHHSAHHKSATSDAPSTQICQACKATCFPNVCESTLSNSNSLPPNPSPSDFILATANASVAGLQTARSMIQSILDAFEKASNINRTNTARICLEVLSYSDRRLSAAFSTALPVDALGDARAWASTTLLYQYDRWSGLKYVNGTAQVSDAMAFTSLPFSALAPAWVFPYPSVPPYWTEQRPSIRPIRVEQATFVRSIRTERRRMREGGLERPKSGRGGELDGRSREGRGAGARGRRRRCRKGFVLDGCGEKI